MPFVTCSCALNYDTQMSPTGCPKCGKPSSPPSDDKIRFFCTCGARLSATGRFVGRTIDCPACGQAAPVPAAGTDTTRPGTTARRPAATAVRRPASRPDGWRSTARWSMFAALIPLAIFTFTDRDDRKRIEDTMKQYPEFARKVSANAGLDDALSVLPRHRIEGAALSRETSAHWVVALLAALIFWEFILIVQPMGNSTSRQLWAVGIFTGTVGIILLTIITITAFVAGILHIPLLKYIGYSYRMATDPRNGFVVSMIGFTIGVGFLEELCKALPLLWHHRRTGLLDMRGSVVWGLATGIGFGVSEGISYSETFYNGLRGGGIYVVRFISCVALHAVWSGTVAILIWRRQQALQNLEHLWQWLRPVFGTLWISMLLHGFYDTCLKKEYGAAALASGMLSFALFFWLYDRASREERRRRTAPALS